VAYTVRAYPGFCSIKQLGVFLLPPGWDAVVHRRVEGATPRLAHLEKFSLNFSSSSFVIRVNLLHPSPSLSLYGVLLSFWYFSILVYYFQVPFNFKAILYTAQITQNTVLEQQIKG